MRVSARGMFAIGVLLLAALSVPGPALAGSATSTVTDLCGRATAGHFACFAQRVTPTTSRGRFKAAAAPSGYGPADLTSAYGLGAAPTGAGRRIYVIAAFDDPNAASDLAHYRATYGLPACTVANGCFKKVNQNGKASPLPKGDAGWAGEISLDLDMVSATCPACAITLVEASSDGDDLLVATKRATTMGARYVSMSWGGNDDGHDTAYDATYLKPSGVVYSVATGDDGYAGGATYPATSPYAIAVGGTSLTRTSGGRGWSETAWSGANSGCTSHESTPSWQASAGTGCSGRAIADVSAVADPATGVAVYDTYGSSGWAQYGGTSAATPLVAAMTARAGVSGSPTAFAYAHASAFNDVTTGANSGLCLAGVMCRAGTGWDGPTGLGTPKGVASFGGSDRAASCSGNLVANPGFESGPAGWSGATGKVHRSKSLAHAGLHFALLDGTGRAHTDRIARTITLPKGCAATLSYYVRVASADRSSKVHDLLVTRVNGSRVTSIGNRKRGPHYARVTVKLTRYAGRTVTLAWVGHENGSLATGFYLDDVKVTLSRG